MMKFELLFLLDNSDLDDYEYEIWLKVFSRILKI